ncbi:hypothetical protein [Aquimarina pacifica]|uniref:hypothetical protein n=1 Tax=Aquimarina pacifica TaxID=1296415 RepID=UPI000472954D|nr:hypothetical protein [Aquimarina pacifica]
MKIKIVLILIVLVLECKESVLQDVDGVKHYTIESVKRSGGQFSSIRKEKLDELLNSFYETMSSSLKFERKRIILFDVFKNNTNYIWYAGDRERGGFFRFISDTEIEKIEYQKIQKSTIKNELQLLRNQ